MKIYEQVCKYCGEGFASNRRQASVCQRCKVREREKWERKPYIVVASPVDELGQPEFPRQARFSADEVKETLRLKYFPAGLVLRYHGKDFRVTGKHLVKVE